MIPLVLSNTMAGFTVSPTTRWQQQIVCVKRMSVLAMGLNTIVVASIPPNANTAPKIFLSRNRLDMKRVHTGSVAAKMITLKTYGNRTNQRLIGEPMRSPLLNRTLVASGEFPVAARPKTSPPFPAPIIEYANLAPESEGK